MTPQELAVAAKEWAAAAWGAYDEWGDDVDQAAIGLIDWASLMLADAMTEAMYLKAAGQLRETADRFEGIQEP